MWAFQEAVTPMGTATMVSLYDRDVTCIDRQCSNTREPRRYDVATIHAPEQRGGSTALRFLILGAAVAAPGATTNWAYGAYLRYRGGKSHAFVLTFQSANLPMIMTLCNMTWVIDLPMPYTSDRFIQDSSQLGLIH